jgi:glycosyltransferase involved in cell wall biosynthesis
VNAVVIVLWRPGDPHRERIWKLARRCWKDAGLDVVEADDPRGLYAARNTGARNSGNWDVAIFADADILLHDYGRAVQALGIAANGGSYVCAYSELEVLDERETKWIRRHADIERRSRAPGVVFTGSWVGCYAISREFFDELGGYDERFYPYYGQDAAIVHAASTLGRLERVPGVAYHLWHPPSLVGHPETGRADLWDRYKAATGDPDAMRELVGPLKEQLA